jgi:hypothetical protein
LIVAWNFGEGSSCVIWCQDVACVDKI